MAGDLVLITGATGFIGSKIAVDALEAGYNVRLAVRREEQINQLKEAFFKYTDQLQFTIVRDFTKEGAFNHALHDVTYVLHVASPLIKQGETDFETDYIQPAVKGTTSILEAAKLAPTVKKVLIMSSIIALMKLGVLDGTAQQTAPVKESNIIHPDTKLVEVNVHGQYSMITQYQGSKILAHQATRDWVQSNKPSFSVATFHPSFVIGPSVLQKKKSEAAPLNDTFYKTIKSGDISIPPYFADVRDVSRAFITAIKEDVPDGQEIIVMGPEVGWSAIARAAEALYPDWKVGLKSDVADSELLPVDRNGYEKILGLKWTSTADLVRGVVDQQRSLEE
ncbi:NAD dependent epimerase dehydratase [Fusarium beomiforme]|uniref:NAD dependent epimerase dehydratase n=1 Tax=Fusarium beomiforme TaxID=44412 RepID=A0A9P5AQ33_9HYPO|nr:NAD dependent epimerase dehydratase [Fusarium beomiforme]